MQRLADQFDYTHDDIAKKIGRARSSVTETMSLRVIPEAIRKTCTENGIVSKSLLLQVSRQPNEKKMGEMVHRISQGNLTRDEARKSRKEETGAAPRPGLRTRRSRRPDEPCRRTGGQTILRD